MRRGNVSIFLALLFPLVLALILTLLESARYGGLRLQAKNAGNAAADSVLAGYNRTLLDRYGLLFYDGGKGCGLISFEDLEEEYSACFTRNLPEEYGSGSLFRSTLSEAKVADLVTATDYNGEVFIRSALDYYKFGAAADLLKELEDQASKVKEGEEALNRANGDKSRLDGTDWGGSVSPEGSIGASFMRSIRFLDAEDEGGGLDEDRLKKELADSPIGKAEEEKAKGFLALVVPSGRKVSVYRADLSEAPSRISVDPRETTGAKLLEDALRKVLFNEYVLSQFVCFTDQAGKQGLNYQTEYVLFGEDSDEENLKKAVNRIMWMREGLNLVHILSSDKWEEVDDIATALFGWTENAVIIELAAMAMAAAWAYGEAVLDMRALLHGKKPAFVKTDDTWTLSLEGLMDLAWDEGIEAKTSDSGMSYEGYLRLMLYLDNVHSIAYKTMDLIQDDLRPEYPNFHMATQVYAVEFRTKIKAGPLFSALPAAFGGLGAGIVYEWEERFSEVY
ncbi:MAG: hypothetical protein IJU49_00315 [Lachnospiraceae bacterium]|nr:hypothetical protein [Lachnospiraceae bacterium]